MDLVRVAAALADPVRIAILRLIAGPMGERSCYPPDAGGTEGVCVCEFTEHLHIAQPRASYHLRILREAGLVIERPHGKWTYYTLNSERVAAFCGELKKISGID